MEPWGLSLRAGGNQADLINKFQGEGSCLKIDLREFNEWLFRNHERLWSKLLDLRSLLTLPCSRKASRDYLNHAATPRLQLGSGRNYLPDWLNTDYFAKPPRFIHLNVTKPFPFPDSSFVRVYSEHMIEHLYQRDGIHMLGECFRVLKPSGRIRIETPDMKKLCSAFQDRSPETLDYIHWHNSEYGIQGYPPTVCFAINNSFRNWGHKFLYDEEMLRMMMARTGFVDIKRFGWNQTDDPLFKGVSQRAGVKPNLYETFVMEGTKPGN
jgi:predicted SAM-dependent methyltransferase